MCYDDPTETILATIERFLTASGMSASAFGEKALGDPVLVLELRRGRELRRATRARIRDFINAALAD